MSVGVPAYRGEQVLRQSLPALLASDVPRAQWELIDVDDASPDDTAAVAAEYADVVVRLRGGPRGPAYARNRGTEASRGEIIVFIDADVCVDSPTLGKFVAAFRTEPELAAVFGSYDANPSAPGIVSQFRNLLHHHVHHQNAGEAE
ncbi:MAG: glycosyltransferase, partial [Longimicrobiales bacterium]